MRQVVIFPSLMLRSLEKESVTVLRIPTNHWRWRQTFASNSMWSICRAILKTVCLSSSTKLLVYSQPVDVVLSDSARMYSTSRTRSWVISAHKHTTTKNYRVFELGGSAIAQVSAIAIPLIASRLSFLCHVRHPTSATHQEIGLSSGSCECRPWPCG
jgi:hypothetical protein